jgi:splicing factor 3B subunit 5
VGHPTLTSFLAIADGEATGRVKFEMMQVCTAPVCVAGGADGVQRMLQPCGPPPPKDED